MPDLKLHNLPGTGPLIRGDFGSGTRAATDFLNFQLNNSEVFSINSAGLPDPGGNQAVRQHLVTVGDIAADSDAITYFLFEVRASLTITKVSFWVDTTTADGSTNKQTMLIEDESSNQIVSKITATANPGATIATWTDMGSVTNGALTAGDYLTMSPTKTSSGLAMSGLAFLFDYTMSG